jgi:DNA-directed RNA polymerase subunit RPC12/RpoP
MNRTRRGIFGHGDLDRYSLAEVSALNVSAGLECRKCRKFSAIDVDDLARRQGCQFTLGEVRQLARCQRCGSKLPFVLIRSHAIRGDRAWFPRPPGAGR